MGTARVRLPLGNPERRVVIEEGGRRWLSRPNPPEVKTIERGGRTLRTAMRDERATEKR